MEKKNPKQKVEERLVNDTESFDPKDFPFQNEEKDKYTIIKEAKEKVKKEGAAFTQEELHTLYGITLSHVEKLEKLYEKHKAGKTKVAFKEMDISVIENGMRKNYVIITKLLNLATVIKESNEQKQ